MPKHIFKTAIAAWLFVFTSYAFAGEDEGFYIWADVVDVEPIVSAHYETVATPECRVVTRRDHRKRDNEVLPTLFGGVLGGVIGNQFGKGNGKRAMTVLGAIAGAIIANQHRNDRPHRERVCETTYEQRRVETVDSYRVTYRYLGQQFERVTEEHPGK